MKLSEVNVVLLIGLLGEVKGLNFAVNATFLNRFNVHLARKLCNLNGLGILNPDFAVGESVKDICAFGKSGKSYLFV